MQTCLSATNTAVNPAKSASNKTKKIAAPGLAGNDDGETNHETSSKTATVVDVVDGASLFYYYRKIPP